jgi:ubiquinone/menaquinone biosynthesis C-methylase UbiE
LILLREIATRLARRIMPREDLNIVQLALGAADVESPVVVLVIGLGDGRLVHELTRRVSAGFVAGIDPDADVIRRATRRNRAGLREGRVELLQASASAIPYPDGMFDVVYAIGLERAGKPSNAALNEVARVLRQGGTFVLCDLPPGRVARIPTPASEDSHTGSMRRMLQRSGFLITGERGTSGRARCAWIVIARLPGSDDE